MSYNSYNNMQNSQRQIIANFIGCVDCTYGAYLIGFRLFDCRAVSFASAAIGAGGRAALRRT